MNQPFSGALLSVAIVLLIIAMVSTPMFRCGLRPLEIPITENPDSFGEFTKEDLISIKYDGTKYLEWDWIPSYHEHVEEIRNASIIVLEADARLNFGAVRETLIELSKHRQSGIILSVEKRFIETKPTPFEEFLERKSRCLCTW